MDNDKYAKSQKIFKKIFICNTLLFFGLVFLDFILNLPAIIETTDELQSVFFPQSELNKFLYEGIFDILNIDFYKLLDLNEEYYYVFSAPGIILLLINTSSIICIVYCCYFRKSMKKVILKIVGLIFAHLFVYFITYYYLMLINGCQYQAFEFWA